MVIVPGGPPEDLLAVGCSQRLGEPESRLLDGGRVANRVVALLDAALEEDLREKLDLRKLCVRPNVRTSERPREQRQALDPRGDCDEDARPTVSSAHPDAVSMRPYRDQIAPR